MIFVTVGTTGFPFDRILRIIDEVVSGFDTREKLIVQKGASLYRFKYKNIKVFAETSFGRMIHFLKKARVTVCGGGPSTIFLALKHGKNKPLVFPRCFKFGEHVDDHEVFFTRFFKNEGKIITVFPEEDAVSKVKNYLHRPESVSSRNQLLVSKELIRKLTEFCHD